MSNDPNRQAQYPPHQWNGHSAANGYPPPPQYPDPRDASYHYPPPNQDMSTMPPQLPAPHQMGAYPPPPPGVYAGQQYQHPQPAPRQRTAIACRYCRRRKIRCSGFETSEDGRCSNCVRFSQECLFTPVSSAAQAFVPAHALHSSLRLSQAQPANRGGGRPLYPQQAPPTQYYGAHGQPLPPGTVPHSPHPDPNLPPPVPYYAQQYAPSYDDRGPTPLAHPSGHHDQVSRKRPRLDEPESPVLSLASAYHASSSYSQVGQDRIGRSGSNSGFEYPDPTNLAPVSPATSTTSYATHPNAQHGYYNAPQPARRSSPQSAYSYEHRASDSPQGSTASIPAGPMGLRPPQALPPAREDGVTPPPGNRSGPGSANGRSGMSVREMLGPGEQGQTRSAIDGSMLSALDRRV